jgi:hypothetical protein
MEEAASIASPVVGAIEAGAGETSGLGEELSTAERAERVIPGLGIIKVLRKWLRLGKTAKKADKAADVTKTGYKFIGKDPKPIRASTSKRMRIAAGKEIEAYSSKMTGGKAAAEEFFKTRTGAYPSGDVVVKESGGLRYTFRPSGTEGAGPPTVEVFDKATGTVEKVRFE